MRCFNGAGDITPDIGRGARLGDGDGGDASMGPVT